MVGMKDDWIGGWFGGRVAGMKVGWDEGWLGRRLVWRK